MVTRPRDSLSYAVGAILIAVFSLSFGGAVIKLISANFSIWQIYIVMVVGSWFAAIAYQRGMPSVIAVFDYSYLIFSAMWGLIIFTETPDLLTVGGMLLIAVAGFISLR